MVAVLGASRPLSAKNKPIILDLVKSVRAGGDGGRLGGKAEIKSLKHTAKISSRRCFGNSCDPAGSCYAATITGRQPLISING